MGTRIEIIGERFVNLVVLKDSGERSNDHKILWECLCDCGKTINVLSSSLRKGYTRSCGCRKVKAKILVIKHKENVKRMYIPSVYEANFPLQSKNEKVFHGYSKNPLYRLFYSIRDRCYNHNNASFSIYGGRGIKICNEWKDNVVSFIEWAEDNGYSKGLQIDRINNNGNYSPENCRFVTQKENNRNKSNCITAVLDGIEKPLMEWAEIYGIKYSLARSRITRCGWDIKTALTAPVQYKYLPNSEM